MGRSIAGVVAGFLYVVAGTMLSEFALGIITVPASADEPVKPIVWPIRIASAAFFALVGGYVTGTVSRRAERIHALTLAVILAAALAFTAIHVLEAEGPPDWFKLTLPAVGFVCTILGGELRSRYVAWMSQRPSSTK
jgi:peptidoglycan/LPS O-acetylase OafA/YrhL